LLVLAAAFFMLCVLLMRGSCVNEDIGSLDTLDYSWWRLLQHFYIAYNGG
jgi:hypothetical protein